MDLFKNLDSLYDSRVQLELLFRPEPVVPGKADPPKTGSRPVSLWFVRNPRARRYVLRLQPDGTARVTIPRRGTMTEARQFAAKHADWLERQLRNRSACRAAISWTIGTEILFRGDRVRLEAGPPGAIRFGDQVVHIANPEGDLRSSIERHLRKLAAKELSNRVIELATLHQFTVIKITVRNQRSRWGSCSPRGTISLNWRLIQAPEFVRDYIILHELAHLKEMNHSRRFWREVARLCPDFANAESWIKQHSKFLL